MATTGWTDKRMACVATYAILEGDQFLDQFDSFFLPFDKAGEVKLTTLPYFPKFGADAFDIEGRADQMARRFFKFLVANYTSRKERAQDSVEGVLRRMKAVFQGKTTPCTLLALANAADDFFKFEGE